MFNNSVGRLALVVGSLILGAFAFVGPASGAAPREGTVVEGYSIPGGVNLDSVRSQVDARLGEPLFCQGPNQYFCNYDSAITIRYVDEPQSPNNSIVSITYADTSLNWTTSAGATLDMLLNDGARLAALYPSARVSGDIANPTHVATVAVPDRGITFSRGRPAYSGQSTASATITRPSGGTAITRPSPTLPPQPEPTTPPQPEPAIDLKATLFDGIKFRDGKLGSTELGVGTFTGSDLVKAAKKATSVRVPAGLQVTLCNSADGSGDCTTLTEDKRRLPRGIRNRVKFVQVSAR